MDKLYIILCLAILCNAALGSSIRHKRQSNPENDEDLEDRYGFPNGFPGQNGPGRFPGQGWDNRPQRPIPNPRPFPTPRPVTPGGNPLPQPTPNAGTTTQSSSVDACIRNCPVTAEYNPVCGTNNVQYFNPGRLTCAQACGLNVSLQRAAPCPPTTPAPAPAAV